MGGYVEELLGSWEITGRLTAGVDDREPDDDAKYLWIGSTVMVTGDEWAAWDMPYVARTGTAYGEIDVTRADTRNPWLQQGIFRVDGGILTICLASAGDPRPTSFASTAGNGCTLYVAKASSKAPPG